LGLAVLAREQIDCSHGNSNKKHENQIIVAKDIADQLASTSEKSTAGNIMGVMIESNLNEGKQSVPAEGPSALKWGVSVTDGTLPLPFLLLELAGTRSEEHNADLTRLHPFYFFTFHLFPFPHQMCLNIPSSTSSHCPPPACLSWQQTVPCLDSLAAGVRARRAALASKREALRSSSRSGSPNGGSVIDNANA
jgi:hypothetical protein